MILEHELLEQIADDERDFAFALWVFDGALERLKRALLWQVGDGLIEIRRVGEARILTDSELKAIKIAFSLRQTSWALRLSRGSTLIP